jgi:streptomycin 6-kinase
MPNLDLFDIHLQRWSAKVASAPCTHTSDLLQSQGNWAGLPAMIKITRDLDEHRRQGASMVGRQWSSAVYADQDTGALLMERATGSSICCTWPEKAKMMQRQTVSAAPSSNCIQEILGTT